MAAYIQMRPRLRPDWVFFLFFGRLYPFLCCFKGDHEQNDDTVTVNGSLYTSKYYAENKDLYFRLRARRKDQVFDPEAKYKGGFPKLYSKSSHPKGDSAGRLVITDKPSGNAERVIF